MFFNDGVNLDRVSLKTLSKFFLTDYEKHPFVSNKKMRQFLFGIPSF